MRLRTKFSPMLFVFGVLLCPLIVMEACRTVRVVRDSETGTIRKSLTVRELLTHPFVHSAHLADFRTELPSVRPVRMLFQPSRTYVEQDTLYQFDLPEESKIILYRSARGRELFMAATIATPSYSIVAGLRTGLPYDTLRTRIVDLPDRGGDTLRLLEDSLPYEVDFYFKDGNLVRFQILGRKVLTEEKREAPR